MSISRRGFLGGIVAALAAPAIIRTPGLLMPVKRALIVEPDSAWVQAEFRSRLGNGVIGACEIGDELRAITMRAFVPKLHVQLYQANPLLAELLNNQPAVDRVLSAFSYEYLPDPGA
jgi:hypothetical protein